MWQHVPVCSMKSFKIGDKVTLKSESQYRMKRVWEITDKNDKGVFTLYRKVKGFVFFEFATSDEIAHRE